MDLAGRLDQVLQVRAGEEVAQVDKFAVPLVFDVDGSPAVLAAAHGLVIDCDGFFRADYSEGDDGLQEGVSVEEGEVLGDGDGLL